MKKHIALLVSLIHAIIFVWLFYKQQIGLNLIVYEVLAIASLLFIFKIQPASWATKIVVIGTFLSGIAVVINFSVYAIFINICSFYLMLGTMVYPEARALLTSALLTVSNSFQSVRLFFEDLAQLKTSNKGLRYLLQFFKIGGIPILIILIFISIYNASNPLFSEGLSKITSFLDEHLADFFSHIDVGIIIMFFVGLGLSIITFYHVKNKIIINWELSQSDKLIRKKNKQELSKPLGLKNEFKSALFLLGTLNLLILIVNIIDIYWVWFNFEWEGEYLKQFVHEGTYLLIFSILISISIVVFYFRANLNFYSKNKIIKIFSYTWLAQNGLLAISVAIRNLWYIKYFALAYKRIGVLFFLILVLYGLYTVFIKVRDKKSLFYLFRMNKLAAYIILIIISFFNWDAIIARYNFNHYQTSFVHFNFLADLSYKALPYLDKNMETLEKIKNTQEKLFPFEEQFMNIDTYHKKIQQKKASFMTRYSEKNLRSWNLAEAIAYKKLKFEGK